MGCGVSGGWVAGGVVLVGEEKVVSGRGAGDLGCLNQDLQSLVGCCLKVGWTGKESVGVLGLRLVEMSLGISNPV